MKKAPYSITTPTDSIIKWEIIHFPNDASAVVLDVSADEPFTTMRVYPFSFSSYRFVNACRILWIKAKCFLGIIK